MISLYAGPDWGGPRGLSLGYQSNGSRPPMLEINLTKWEKTCCFGVNCLQLNLFESRLKKIPWCSGLTTLDRILIRCMIVLKDLSSDELKAAGNQSVPQDLFRWLGHFINRWIVSVCNLRQHIHVQGTKGTQHWVSCTSSSRERVYRTRYQTLK